MSTALISEDNISSDMLHNQNCYAYLNQLRPFISSNLIDLLPGLSALTKLDEQYEASYPYGNLYSYTLAYLEDQIDEVYKTLSKRKAKELDLLIFSIYHNDNHILENAHWINRIGAKIRPKQVDIGSEIAKALTKDRYTQVNTLSPTNVENPLNRFLTLFTPNFKPQLDTNIPSIKHFSFDKYSKNKEFRFSTQAQRHNGSVRISPLFLRWLEINAQKYPPEQQICHIYFNNLGLDRNDLLDIPGTNEKQLSLELHKLENNPKYKIAVITLPASNALMGAYLYKKLDDKLTYSQVFTELLDVAEGKMHQSGVSDFHISPAIRNMLFSEKTNQSQVLTKLLTNSFECMGIMEHELLSTAQKQAVWLHFTKYELTDYIIKSLTPNNHSIGYNFSCRDAIDRGAVSSVYYNLLKSIKTGRPIQRDEFERSLDIAAANVKGRGMNFHRKLIWNALDTLINANYAAYKQDERLSWLINWRDMNCPHSRVDSLITIRMEQCKEQFYDLSTNQQKLKKSGLKLLDQIDHQFKEKVNGQRLLLEVVARTSQLLSTNPTEESIKEYNNLATELRINYPILHIVAGLMETLLGLILYIPTLSYSNGLITQGISLAKTGFFATERASLCSALLEFSKYNSSGPVA
ncbi:hypothetical protein [Legionella moravica]|uniref:hypothetical protein n=1 Tax=Legionella moravica TaxID=39962 RepID=UPI00048E7DEF|nr:hypothetical protein [Legionella moravica]